MAPSRATAGIAPESLSLRFYVFSRHLLHLKQPLLHQPAFSAWPITREWIFCLSLWFNALMILSQFSPPDVLLNISSSYVTSPVSETPFFHGEAKQYLMVSDVKGKNERQICRVQFWRHMFCIFICLSLWSSFLYVHLKCHCFIVRINYLFSFSKTECTI